MDRMKSNILVTSAGQRVSLVRAFQKEIKKDFPAAKVLTIDMNPEISPACRISDGFFKVKRVTDPHYISELVALCEKESIGMIVPTIDTELQVLSEHRDCFESKGIHVIVAAKAFVDACRDKRMINEFFKERGIEIPKSIEKENPTFPLFIKPYDGSLSVDTFLVKSIDQLTDYQLSNPKLMFMEYMDKNDYDEYTIDMYYGRDHQVKAIVPRLRMLVRAGEINKGVTCKNEIVGLLKDKLGYIEGAVGCLTTQVFFGKSNGRMVGIEINPRFGGGYPLSYLSGANFPGWLINEYFLNKPVDYMESWEDNLLMLRYDDEVLVHDYKQSR
jgi:carbamoyl-phosphate synthase large subunit